MIACDSNAFWIGSDDGNGNDVGDTASSFSGSMDEVALWSRALTDGTSGSAN